MSESRAPNPFARFLRRLERLMGAHREDRSLWVWAGPITTVVAIFVALIAFGIVNGVDLPLTIPMALIMAVFMGTLSAFYLTASSADEADGDDGPRPPLPPGPTPPRRADASAAPVQRDRVPVASRPRVRAGRPPRE